jgi:hypothetical protein
MASHPLDLYFVLGLLGYLHGTKKGGGVGEQAYVASPLIRQRHEKLLQTFHGHVSFIIKGRSSF